MGDKGGGGGGTTTSMSQSQPWQGLMPYLKELYQGASAAQKATPTAPWGGPLTASPRPETIAGQDYTMQLANSFQGAGNSSIQLASDMLAGKYLDPNSNPYFSGAVTAALRPIQDEFYNTTLPGISDKAIGEGAYGGDREGITKALASTGFTKNLADTSANMAWSNYANERGLQLQAPTLLQQGEALNMIPSAMYGQVGAARQQTEQDKLNEAYGLYQQQQTAPWTGLSQLSTILQGGGAGNAGASSSTSTGPPGTPAWIQGALGGAGLGAAIGNMGWGSGGTGWGAGVGGTIGAILPLLALL